MLELDSYSESQQRPNIYSEDDIDNRSHSTENSGSAYNQGGRGGNGRHRMSLDEVQMLSAKETKKICIWKSMLVIMIIITAAAVSSSCYKFLHKEEDNDYNDNYDQMVNTIRDASEFHAQSIFTTLKSFSHQITTEAIALNETFPFVTLPSFEAIGSSVRAITGAEMINWHARVEQDQLSEWSSYAISNYQRNLNISRSIALSLTNNGGQQQEASKDPNATTSGTESDNYNDGDGSKTTWISSVIPSDYFDGDIAPFPYIPNFQEGGIILAPNYGDGPFWPAWMVSPPIFNPGFINSDPAPWALKGPITAVVEASDLVLTDSVPVENLANRAIKYEDHEAYHLSLVDYVNEDEKTAFLHPHFSVMVPVFEELNNPKSRLVGTFVAVFPWDRFFIDLLPEGADGISCVLRNSCGKAWTYELSGNSAFYVGEGDYHDHDYNDTEVVLPFHDPSNPNGHGDTSMTNVPNGECSYTYHTYATKKFEDRYRSKIPLIVTLVVAATFTVMILTFMVYDFFVYVRNEKVVGHATRTNAIVSSLFPAQVKQQLLEEEEKAKKKKRLAAKGSNGGAKPLASKGSFEVAKMRNGNNPELDVENGTKLSAPSRLQRFLSKNENDERLNDENNDENNAKKSAPIASLYEECTVFFADIAGFTLWSSSREPVEVFALLETIYGAFDKIARRRNIFKVETIGDCYLAITGLPEARSDHAVAMAKFAAETRDTMRRVCKKLVSTLGRGTESLELRVGLHSGAVTAGVLRGEKSRFQLFGDTVNTAARMESNGIKGKIQVSKETADKLIQAGKSHWLTQRADKITAKGKGELQTYWVEIVSSASLSRSRTSTLTSGAASSAASKGSANDQPDSDESDESNQEEEKTGEETDEVVETTDEQVSDELHLDSDFEDDDSEILYHC